MEQLIDAPGNGANTRGRWMPGVKHGQDEFRQRDRKAARLDQRRIDAARRERPLVNIGHSTSGESVLRNPETSCSIRMLPV